jgi:predicted amidohydrolase YtcJ
MPDTFDTYRHVAREGLLTARVVGALWWDRRRDIDQVVDLLARRQAASDGRFRATTVKVMVDGVCETRTAAMSRAYRVNGRGQPDFDRSNLFIEPDRLADAVSSLDAEGFQIHFHAIGDAAVTATLDALARLKSPAAHRHHLAHLQFVKPEDLDRFVSLGAVANCQPLWACNDFTMLDLTLPIIDSEQASWQFPFGSLKSRGVPMAFGSDWPVSSCDPLQQIHVAVNRRLSRRLGRSGSAETDQPFLLEEAVSVTDAVSAFTEGTAFVNHEDHIAGVLATGRLADVAVLDQNIFDIPADGIGDTSVVLTVAGGQVVYGHE